MPRRGKKKALKPASRGRAAGTDRAIAQVVDVNVPFGPSFFMTQLRGLVRDRCPLGAEDCPRVEFLLRSGESVDVSHVIGVAPRYVALAVYEGVDTETPTMRSEMLPYELIVRIVIRSGRPDKGPSFGFKMAQTPQLIAKRSTFSPDEALRVVSTAPPIEAKDQG